jgi:dynein heavy chain, axonemal
LKFDDETNKLIKGIKSCEGELIHLIQSVSTSETQGMVEKWLLQVEKLMKMSIRKEIFKSIAEHEIRSRIDWLNHCPGQISLICNNLFWTNQVTKVIKTIFF